MNMNYFLTIVATSLSVSAFAFIFFPDRNIAAITAVSTFFLSLILFAVEQIFRQNGSQIINAVMFFFTKNGKYIFEEKKVDYERKSDTEWELKKSYTIKSKCRALEEYDDRFSWSANSDDCKITALESGQHVTRIREIEKWTMYTVAFDHSIRRGSRAVTGSTISNLIADQAHVKPYLSITITEKTGSLRMSIKIPKKYNPKNGTLSVYSSSSSSSDSSVFRKKLEYNTDDETFSETITFPRKKWKYVITWEY